MSADRPRLKVLASFFPPAVVALNIAGTNADVEVLLDGRVDPHDFQFSRGDLTKISQADLIVLNGLGMESWLERALTNGISRQPAVELATDLPPACLIATTSNEAHFHRESAGHDETGRNPHIWLDPLLLAHGATNVLRALQKANPGNAGAFEANARAFVGKLWDLDAELRRELAPVRGVRVVTWHDAFAYFARRYGPEIIGVIEPLAEVDPSPRYLAELSRRCRVDGVKAVFDDPGSRSRLVARLAADWGARMATLETLESHALAPDAYFEAMRSNARILRETLR